jgi:demethylmenaquinone methyltransferase/2-methoxy-6-polyprenyl-1,4-benzoquinol methylase
VRTGGRNRFAQRLFTPLPARYDRLAEILSMGQNGRWRREMVSRIVAHPAPAAAAPAAAPAAAAAAEAGRPPSAGSAPEPPLVLDVASGTAGVAIQLAARTRARVVGVDLTEAMLRQGQANVADAELSRSIGLVAGKAEQLPFPDASFDALTFTYLLRYVDDPQAVLTELGRVVKPGGTMASLEFCVPPSAFWRAWWVLYTRIILPAGGLALGGRAWLRVGRFLGPNITGHYRRYPVPWTAEAWRRAGFTGVQTKIMSLGGGLVMWGQRTRD